MNQFSDSEDETSDADDLEEGLEECNLSNSDDVVDDALYCVACNKFFNSESAKLNHEASKKHKQNMELLKSEMTKEEEDFQKTVKNDLDSNAELKSEDEMEKESEATKKAKGKKSKKKNKKIVNYESDEDLMHEEVKAETDVEETLISETKIIQSDDDDWSNSKKSKKVKSKVKAKNDKSKPVELEVKLEETPAEATPPTKEEMDPDNGDHRCATCRDIFPSKNKLFAHLKKTNHSIFLGEVKAKIAEKANSKRKK